MSLASFNILPAGLLWCHKKAWFGSERQVTDDTKHVLAGPATVALQSEGNPELVTLILQGIQRSYYFLQILTYIQIVYSVWSFLEPDMIFFRKGHQKFITLTLGRQR